MVDLARLNAVVDEIGRRHDSFPSAGVQIDGLLVTTTGRNPVWKVTDTGGAAFFVKRWTDPGAFCRELTGLRVASRMAVDSPIFMAADVLLAEPATGFIVTSALDGKSLAELLQQAYRIDKNPLRRPEPIAVARQALELVAAWWARLHEQPAPEDDCLLDHSLRGTSARIQRKLSALEGFPVTGALQTFAAARALADALSASGPENRSIVFGDASPGNFLIAGHRVGAVDFEDMGTGDPARDSSVMAHHLEVLGGQWHYWPCRDLRGALATDLTPPKRALFLLELHVDKVTNTMLRSGRPRGTPSPQRAVGELKEWVRESRVHAERRPQ